MENGYAVDEILILLVDADASNSSYLSNVLLEFNYGVVTANCGEEALSVLQQNLHGIQLVLVTNIKLPDMCPFELIEIVERECRLPVVLICDTYVETTFLRGRSCGAVLVLAKPLCFHDIENLWRHCSMKDRHVRVDSLDLRVESVERDSCESSLTSAPEKEPVLHESGGISRGHKKRKMQELEKDEGLSVEQPVSFVWTPFIQYCFDIVILQLGLYNASPLEVLRRVNAPGLTLELVMERMQQYDYRLQQLRKPQSEMISHFPSYLNSLNQPLVANMSVNHGNNASTTLASTHGWRSTSELMPSTLELPPALLPAAPSTTAAEGLFQSSLFGAIKAPSESSTAPMVRQQAGDEIESKEQIQSHPLFSISPDSNGAI